MNRCSTLVIREMKDKTLINTELLFLNINQNLKIMTIINFGQDEKQHCFGSIQSLWK